MKKFYEVPSYEVEKFRIQDITTGVESVITEETPKDDFDF